MTTHRDSINAYLNRAFTMGVSLRIDSTKEAKLGDGKKYLQVSASAELIKDGNPLATKRNIHTQAIYPITRDNLEEFNETMDLALVGVFCKFVGEPLVLGTGPIAKPTAARPAPVVPPAPPTARLPIPSESVYADDGQVETEVATEVETETPDAPPPPPAPAAAAGIPKLVPETGAKRGRGRPPKAATEEAPAEKPATPPGPKTRTSKAKPDPVVVKYTIGDKTLAPVFGQTAMEILGFDPRTDPQWKAFVLGIRVELVGTPCTVDGVVTQEFRDAMTALLKPDAE